MFGRSSLLCVFITKDVLFRSSNGSSQINLQVGHEVARHLQLANKAFFVSCGIYSVLIIINDIIVFFYSLVLIHLSHGFESNYYSLSCNRKTSERTEYHQLEVHNLVCNAMK